MALNFPNSPINGQTYLGDNGVTYTYDGVKWSGTSVEYGSGLPIATTSQPGLVQPDGTTITIVNGVISSSGGGSTNKLVNGVSEVVLDEGGMLTVPGTIALQDGVITSNDNTDPGIVLGSSNKSVFVRTLSGVDQSTWKFGTDGSLQMPGTGVSDYQYNAAQEITVLADAAPTVVFTSVNSSVESIKVIVKVSVAQAPADGFDVVDSQICEMLITSKSAVPVGGGTMVRTAVATVYGVTHTSATPLATFTVNYFNNPVGPSVIQILAQPTAAVTGTDMVVTTVATELANYF